MKTFSFVTLMATLLAWSSAAQAAVIINIVQSGSNVIASGSGTLDTTDLTILSTPTNASGVVYGAFAAARLGPTASSTYETLITASGPTSFVGSGTSFQANFGEGDIFGVAGFGHQIYAPQGYVSGSSLMADDTFSFTTLAALGLTPGTYTYTWGTDAHADSLVLNIGSPSAVPEPSSLAMCGLAGLIGASYAWRRRQRAPSA